MAASSIVLDQVSWKFYEHLLEELGDRPIRVTYDTGTMEIMEPLGNHEIWKRRISPMIEIMCLERDIEAIPAGSPTLKREDKGKGLEPDESYYVQHADVVRFRENLDITIDPPPD